MISTTARLSTNTRLSRALCFRTVSSTHVQPVSSFGALFHSQSMNFTKTHDQRAYSTSANTTATSSSFSTLQQIFLLVAFCATGAFFGTHFGGHFAQRIKGGIDEEEEREQALEE